MQDINRSAAIEGGAGTPIRVSSRTTSSPPSISSEAETDTEPSSTSETDTNNACIAVVLPDTPKLTVPTVHTDKSFKLSNEHPTTQDPAYFKTNNCNFQVVPSSSPSKTHNISLVEDNEFGPNLSNEANPTQICENNKQIPLDNVELNSNREDSQKLEDSVLSDAVETKTVESEHIVQQRYFMLDRICHNLKFLVRKHEILCQERIHVWCAGNGDSMHVMKQRC